MCGSLRARANIKTSLKSSELPQILEYSSKNPMIFPPIPCKRWKAGGINEFVGNAINGGLLNDLAGFIPISRNGPAWISPDLMSIRFASHNRHGKFEEHPWWPKNEEAILRSQQTFLNFIIILEFKSNITYQSILKLVRCSFPSSNSISFIVVICSKTGPKLRFIFS